MAFLLSLSWTKRHQQRNGSETWLLKQVSCRWGLQGVALVTKGWKYKVIHYFCFKIYFSWDFVKSGLFRLNVFVFTVVVIYDVSLQDVSRILMEKVHRSIIILYWVVITKKKVFFNKGIMHYWNKRNTMKYAKKYSASHILNTIKTLSSWTH